MPTPLPQSQPKERFPLVDLFFLLVLFWQFVILTPSLLFSPLKHTHTLTHKLYSHGFLVLAPDPMLSAFPFLELILVTWKAGSRVTAHIKKKKKKSSAREVRDSAPWLSLPSSLPSSRPPSKDAQWCAAGTQEEKLRRWQQQRRQRSWKPAAAPSPSSIECSKRQFCILKKPIERPIAFPARLKLAAFYFFLWSPPTTPQPPCLQLQQKEGRERERESLNSSFFFFFSPPMFNAKKKKKSPAK